MIFAPNADRIECRCQRLSASSVRLSPLFSEKEQRKTAGAFAVNSAVRAGKPRYSAKNEGPAADNFRPEQGKQREIAITEVVMRTRPRQQMDALRGRCANASCGCGAVDRQRGARDKRGFVGDQE